MLAGIAGAIGNSFVNDDAFISFRYAENLVAGEGLVYNKGERVEGYTNFLWTLLIAAGLKYGIDPVDFSAFLGILFYAGTLMIFILQSARDRKGALWLVPLTSASLCLNRDFSVYATSGLETSAFTFFLAAAFFNLLSGKKTVGALIGGSFTLLAMLTRPDGVIFLISVLVYFFLKGEGAARRSAYFLLPVVAVFLPYWLWRWHYYGFFFPNSFYAKSISTPYYGQGAEYLFLYFKTYYGLGLLLIAAGYFILKYKKIRPLIDELRSERNQPTLLACLISAGFILFIIRIGGDFMHARLLIPATPFFYFLAERYLRSLKKAALRTALASALMLTTFWRNDLYTKEINVGYVVDEAQYYTREHLEQAKHFAAVLKKYFSDLPVRIGFYGARARVIYYSSVPYAIEASTGLTDTALAHAGLERRGRPGHEKSATLPFLQGRNVHFLIPPPSRQTADIPPLELIRLDTFFLRIVTYDRSIMDQLAKAPGLEFTRADRYLDSILISWHPLTKEKLLKNYEILRNYYFLPSHDTLMEKRYLLAIR